MLGTELGAYRIVAEVGSGGMGTVYRAEVVGRVPGLSTGDTVAVKVVHAHLMKTPGFFKRFLREGEIGKRIRHPNVVATYDLDGIKVGGDTVLYIAMEFVEGKSLWQLFQELGPLPDDLARHLGAEVAKGLQAIHDLGVVHRDLKPENVIVSSSHEVKVMDLGVARMDDEIGHLSQTGSFVGTALYAAPESFGGPAPRSREGTARSAKGVDAVDGRADLYALGLLLYELTTGVHPFDADDLPQILRRVMTETPKRASELNPRVSPFLAEVLHRLLAKDREERFDSAQELFETLVQGEASPWWTSRDVASAARVAGPSRRLRVARDTPLFGRDADMLRLRAAFERACAHEPAVVLIEGEPGIGKTRLVDAFVAAARDRGEDVQFLFGAFPPGAASSAFDTALREFHGDGLPAAVREAMPGEPGLAAAHLARLRGVRSPTGSQPLGADAVAAATVVLVRSLTARAPVVVFVDDLHFASQQGLDLFASIAAALEGCRVMLVAAARPGLPDDWTAALVRAGRVQRLALPRLGLKDSARLLVAAVGSAELADEIGFRIMPMSSGNPFFLLEILRSLRETGVVATGADGAPHMARTFRELRLPASLLEILTSRIAALGDDDRDVLEIAACCGFEFEPRLVADAMRVERLALIRHLGRLERVHGVVHPVGERFLFDSRALHEVLRAGIPDALSRECHAALASALEDDAARETSPGRTEAARAEQLANMWLDAGDARRALPHVAPALDHLDGIHATDVAVGLAARALAAPGLVEGDARFEMLLRQAERLGLTGRHAAEEEAAAEALALPGEPGASSNRARALVAHGRAALDLARHDDARRRLAEAIALSAACGRDDVQAQARGVMGEIDRERGRYREAIAEHQREAALCERSDDAAAAGAAAGRIGLVHFEVGRYDQAYRCFRRELAAALDARDRRGRAGAGTHIGRTLFALGRYDDALAQVGRALSLTRIIGFRRGETTALNALGEIALAIGDTASAHRHFARAALVARESGTRFELGRALHGLASVSAARGEVPAAVGQARVALALRRELGDVAGVVDSLLLAGNLSEAAGSWQDAGNAFVEAFDLARAVGRAEGHALAAAHLAVLPGGGANAARAVLRANETRIAVGARIEAHTLLWRATRSPDHLEEARLLAAHVLAHVPAEFRDALAARMLVDAPAAASL